MTFAYEPLAGGEVLEEHLTAIEDRAADMAPAWEAIVKSFHALERERFDQNGPGWLPLAASTVADRERKGSNPDQILQDTGLLLASLEGGSGSYVIETPVSVEVGTTVPYAHWHQTGGTRLHASGAGWPPQRKIVNVDEKLAAEWAGIVEGWIFEGIVEGA